MGVTSVFSYQDELDPDVSMILEDVRQQDHDEEEPFLCIAGFGKSGLLVTSARIYLIRIGYLMTHRWDEAYVGVHPLASLADVRVVMRWFTARGILHFLDERETDFFLTKPRDRDKLRLAARMLLHWAERARSFEAQDRLAEVHTRTGVRVPSAQGLGGFLRGGAEPSVHGGIGSSMHAPNEAAAARLPSLAVADQHLDDAPYGPIRPGAVASPTQGPRPMMATTDAVTLLKSLWDLAQSGALTSEEYEAKKIEILRRV